MLIAGARIAINATTAVKMNLWITRGSISLTPVRSAETPTVDLEGFLVLPGLINAHDHLELNLFPRLGRGPYANASAWAHDIYRPLEPPVQQHLAVPKPIRLTWGAIKNLLAGVTTVAHHNALHQILFHRGFPIRVVKRFGWAHSPEFSSDWPLLARATPRNYPFIMHAAEGTDETARREIRMLAEAGALNASTVLIHGVALTGSDAPKLESAGVSLVWCPSSNYFTLGRSIDGALLKSKIPIALGTDSAMTAEGDLLDELRVAHRSVDINQLYSMVTVAPAQILKLPAGHGTICHRGPADLLVMRDDGLTPAQTLLANCPQLVIVGGRIVLASSEFACTHPLRVFRSLSPLRVEGRGRYLLPKQVGSLLSATENALGERPRLARKAIAA